MCYVKCSCIELDMSVAWNFYWKLIFFVLQCTLVKIACFLFLFKSCGLFFIFILPITHLREIELFPLSRSLWALKILFLHVVSVEWNAFLIKTVYKLQGCWLSCQTSLLNLFQYPWWSFFVDFFFPPPWQLLGVLPQYSHASIVQLSLWKWSTKRDMLRLYLWICFSKRIYLSLNCAGTSWKLLIDCN